jgi:hypothetical protein
MPFFVTGFSIIREEGGTARKRADDCDGGEEASQEV